MKQVMSLAVRMISNDRVDYFHELETEARAKEAIKEILCFSK